MTKAQLGIRDAVSRHTRVKKDTVSKVMEAYLEEVGEAHPVVEIYLNSPSFSLRIGVSKNTIALGKMMFFKYLEKTELFSDVVALLRNETEVVAFYSGGALLIIREAYDYSGIGGIFVKKAKSDTGGYVIEPIKHYLEEEYPVYFEE
jgi:hypothetical protein